MSANKHIERKGEPKNVERSEKEEQKLPKRKQKGWLAGELFS
jgi:hypothetical protein